MAGSQAAFELGAAGKAQAGNLARCNKASTGEAKKDEEKYSTLWNIGLAALVCCVYASGFFVNSAASRLLPEESTGPAQLMVMMAVGRIIGLASTFAMLAFMGGLPSKEHSERMFCSPCAGGVVSIFIQMFVLLGFIPYFILSATGDISAIAPLVGVHSMVPVVYGMLIGGERRTMLKVIAALLSLASVLLLGFAAAGGNQAASEEHSVDGS